MGVQDGVRVLEHAVDDGCRALAVDFQLARGLIRQARGEPAPGVKIRTGGTGRLTSTTLPLISRHMVPVDSIPANTESAVSILSSLPGPSLLQPRAPTGKFAQSSEASVLVGQLE